MVAAGLVGEPGETRAAGRAAPGAVGRPALASPTASPTAAAAAAVVRRTVVRVLGRIAGGVVGREEGAPARSRSRRGRRGACRRSSRLRVAKTPARPPAPGCAWTSADRLEIVDARATAGGRQGQAQGDPGQGAASSPSSHACDHPCMASVRQGGPRLSRASALPGFRPLNRKPRMRTAGARRGRWPRSSTWESPCGRASSRRTGPALRAGCR